MNIEPINIILVEDHQLVREGLARLLRENKCFTVSGEAANGKQLLELLPKTKADVILLDLEMPVMSGKEVLPLIKKYYPAVKVIILSTYYDQAFVTEFFEQGVNAYLHKTCNHEELTNAILSVYEENYYFTRSVSKYILSKILHDKEKRKELEKVKLTTTEIEIIQLMADEKSTSEIAKELNITIGSVNYYRRTILEKTRQKSSIGLLKFAIKHGITEINL